MLKQENLPSTIAEHERYMSAALQEAREAAERGEVPVGAVVVCNGQIIARGHNLTQTLCDVTAHAEMQAITSASDYLGGKYLVGCTLYVTVEPCIMCAGALGWSQISQVVFGATDPKRGAISFYGRAQGAVSPFHPKTVICGGVLAEDCASLMTEFFKSRRK